MSVPAACNNTDPNIILSYYDEVSTFQYGIPFVYFYFNDFAVTVGIDVVFHLHGFEDK